MSDARRQAFRALAAGLDRIDRAVYEAYGKDPLEPTLGAGDPRCRVAILGRDPGRHEVEHGQPFVGVGGQKVRAALYRSVHGTELPGFAESLEIGKTAFWANTVPYKPLGNKAWPVRTVRAFAPHVRDLLVNGWQGTELLALGRVAFFWFGLDDKATKARIAEHWARDDRFEQPLEVVVTAPGGESRAISVRPLPHPSPLNATWAPHVPRLLDEALAAAGHGPESWRR